MACDTEVTSHEAIDAVEDETGTMFMSSEHATGRQRAHKAYLESVKILIRSLGCPALIMCLALSVLSKSPSIVLRLRVRR